MDSSARALDAIDRKILRILQEDGRITNVDLSRKVNLSPTPCLERVRRLERDGYILGYRARLDPTKLEAGLLIFAQVTLDRTTPDVFERFKQDVMDVPQVLECHMVAGGFDYLIKVRVADMAAYRLLLGDYLAKLPGILQTHTYVVMEEVKDQPGLPIGR
ncbi:winged helix-turn-helix transcriptional regulator [Inquilinus sp. CAU 1745]|uniref:winged helix-turn-helix transcriptional regulator n=1 Tax=Inquilinus sp. CAU 1745 TaxID=3140369 RepID=UPI00325B3B07